jgi:hypothetical protein
VNTEVTVRRHRFALSGEFGVADRAGAVETVRRSAN